MEMLLNSAKNEYISSQSRLSFTKRLAIDVIIALGLSFGQLNFVIRQFALDYSISNAFAGNPADGFIRILNEIADILGRSQYILLTRYDVSSGGYGLSITVLFIVLSLISFLIIKSEIPALFILYYIMPFISIFALKVSIAPREIFLIFLFTFLGVLSVRYGENFRFYLSATVAAVFILLGIIISKAPGYEIFSVKPEFTGAITEHTDEFIYKIRYGKRDIDGEDTAFRITMEKPESTWLRGYVGERYDGNEWIANSNNSQYEYLETGEILNNRGFNAIGQLAMAGNLIEKRDSSRISIEMKKANREHMLIPYEMADREISNSVNYGDSFIKSEGLFGEKKYSYAAYPNLTSEWTDITGKVFTGIVKNKLPMEYREDEGVLNIHNYKSFTYLDDQTRFLINNELGDTVDSDQEHVDYKLAIDKILSYTENKLMYTPENGDTRLENTVKSRKGNDRAYASLATAMFRYYKIPARYVEGYQITREDVKNMKPDTGYDIKGENFHAWCEIYIDSIGWVPIETVPQFLDKTNQANLDRGIDNENLIRDFKKHSEAFTGDEDMDIVLDDNVKEGRSSVLSVFAIILLILLFLIILYKLIRILVVMIKTALSFRQKDVKAAIRCIYHELNKGYTGFEQKTVHIGNRASYSPYSMSEDDRSYMLDRWRKKRRYYEKIY